MDLDSWSDQLRIFADSTRVRLLALLEREELTVAELSAITHLQQPRVSTHLAKLREANMVRDRRSGVSAYYRMAPEALNPQSRMIWRAITEQSDDSLLAQDAQRMQEVLQERAREQNHIDSVAGDLERHYSPGRTWEALARSAMQLLSVGDVIDIASGDGAMAELLAPNSRRYVCLDASEKAIKSSATRLRTLKNVESVVGDMHRLDFPDASFDLALLLQSLNYADKPQQAVDEATRVLRPGGRLLLTTLARHPHAFVHETYSHSNQGFDLAQLKTMLRKSGLQVHACHALAREQRPPHFQILVAIADKPNTTRKST